MGDDFFNNLRQTLSDTAEVVGKKTEELVEVQKLRSRIRTAQKQAEQEPERPPSHVLPPSAQSFHRRLRRYPFCSGVIR